MRVFTKAMSSQPVCRLSMACAHQIYFGSEAPARFRVDQESLEILENKGTFKNAKGNLEKLGSALKKPSVKINENFCISNFAYSNFLKISKIEFYHMLGIASKDFCQCYSFPKRKCNKALA